MRYQFVNRANTIPKMPLPVVPVLVRYMPEEPGSVLQGHSTWRLFFYLYSDSCIVCRFLLCSPVHDCRRLLHLVSMHLLLFQLLATANMIFYLFTNSVSNL